MISSTVLFLVILLIINALVLFLSFATYVMTLTNRMQINQMHSATTNMAAKLTAVEFALGKVTTAFTEFTEMSSEVFEQLAMGFGGEVRQVYRTMDGKYAADSLEELVDKIHKDGKQKEYLTEDMDQLRKLFEQEADAFDDDDDEEDDGPFPR